MKKIRGILVDVEKGISPFNQEIKDAHDIADMLKCEYVTCVRRYVGGEYVDIYCDEEALLKPARDPAIITKHNGKIVEILYGNCLLCLHNKQGDMKSLPHRMFEPIMLAQANVKVGEKWYLCLQSSLM